MWSDETYVNKNYVKKQCLCDDSMVVNQPSGVGPRWNIVHWMAEVNGGDSYALAGAVAQGVPGIRIGTAVVPGCGARGSGAPC